MKKCNRFIATALLLLALNAQAQEMQVTTTQELRVHLNDGSTRTFSLSQIDSLDIMQRNDTTWLGLPALRIARPTDADFAQSQVLSVAYGGQKVAEICREYIKPAAGRLDVVYVVGNDGHAQLTDGRLFTSGSKVQWNVETNSVTLTEGTDEETDCLYLIEGSLYSALPSDTRCEDATVQPERLIDVRGTEELRYAIVKIGTQYWMAENLATEFFADATPITAYTSAQGSSWNQDTTGATHVYADNDDFLSVYGRLYNGYAVMSEHRLAPEGWTIPTADEWRKLRTYAGAAAANYKSDVTLSWLNDGEGTNVTGFNAMPGGYFSSATGDSGEGQDAWFWSSTSQYDILTRSNALEYFRLNNTAANSVVSNNAGHAYQFGHSVRCIRQ